MNGPVGFEAMCALVALEPGELERWIALRWVMPEGAAGVWTFQAVDVARVRLIVELRRDLEIDEVAMPVVLGLLDRLYDARRRMKALAEALEALPAAQRASLKRWLEE